MAISLSSLRDISCSRSRFWRRAWRQERLSDALFGTLLMVMAFEIWEYMLGFGGVEFLWQELAFFPRNFSLLLPPLAYFYLKSQLNTEMRLQWRDLLHALPFILHALYHLLVFAQGAAFVTVWENDVAVTARKPIRKISFFI